MSSSRVKRPPPCEQYGSDYELYNRGKTKFCRRNPYATFDKEKKVRFELESELEKIKEKIGRCDLALTESRDKECDLVKNVKGSAELKKCIKDTNALLEEKEELTRKLIKEGKKREKLLDESEDKIMELEAKYLNLLESSEIKRMNSDETCQREIEALSKKIDNCITNNSRHVKDIGDLSQLYRDCKLTDDKNKHDQERLMSERAYYRDDGEMKRSEIERLTRLNNDLENNITSKTLSYEDRIGELELELENTQNLGKQCAVGIEECKMREYEISVKKNRLEQEIEKVFKVQIEKLNSQIIHLEGESKQCSSDLSTCTSVKSNLEKEVKQCINDLSGEKKGNKDTREKLQTCIIKGKQLNTEAKKLNEKIHEMDQRIISMKNIIKKLRSFGNEMESQKLTAESEIETLKLKIRANDDEINMYKKEIVDIKNEMARLSRVSEEKIKDCEAREDRLKGDVLGINSKHVAEKRELQGICSRNKTELEKMRRENSEKYDILEGQLNGKTREYNQCINERNEYVQKIASEVSNVKDLGQSIKEKNEIIADKEKIISRLTASIGRLKREAV